MFLHAWKVEIPSYGNYPGIKIEINPDNEFIEMLDKLELTFPPD